MKSTAPEKAETIICIKACHLGNIVLERYLLINYKNNRFRFCNMIYEFPFRLKSQACPSQSV